MAAAHVRKHIQKTDTRCRSERSLPKQRTLADFLVPLTMNKSQKTQSCQLAKGNQSSLEYSHGGYSAQILSTYCLPAPVEVQTQSSANSQTLPTPERTVLNPQMTRLTRAQILAQTVNISRLVTLKPTCPHTSPWIPGTMDLYSRPTEAQSSQDWPTKFPIWNMRKPGLKLQETTFQVAYNIAKDAFYIAADVWSRKDGKTWGVGKKFGAISSAESFVTELLEISKTRCFYEIIRQGRPCKAYFDLEADAGIMTEEQGWIMCKSVIQLWNDRINVGGQKLSWNVPNVLPIWC